MTSHDSPAELLPGATSRPVRFAVWLLLSALATAAISWAAFQLQQDGFAPAVLFPLGVGAALGAILAAISKELRALGRRTAVAAAIVWGLLAVLGQDYIGHGRHLREYAGELERHGPLAAAALDADALQPTFPEYLSARVRSQPGWWCLEALLTATAAAIVTAYAIGRRQDSTSNEA